MGRRVLLFAATANAASSLSLLVVVAGVAATIAVIAALCGSHGGRRKSPTSALQPQLEDQPVPLHPAAREILKAVTRSLSMVRWPSKEEEEEEERGGVRFDHQDSIWMKTIILGEKCRVSGDEDHGVIYEATNGNKISAYHPRTPSSLPVSRQSSFIDLDAVSRLELGRVQRTESYR